MARLKYQLCLLPVIRIKLNMSPFKKLTYILCLKSVGSNGLKMVIYSNFRLQRPATLNKVVICDKIILV